MEGRLLVVGASGNVGRHVARFLVEAGQVVRAAGRDPARLAEVSELEGAEPVRFDFADAATWGPALEGVDRVFLMRPPDVTDTTGVVQPVIERMRDAGVRHVTFLSLLGVNPAMPHWRIERDLRASELTTTFLRAGFFAQNLDTAFRDGIRDHDRIRLPAGRGRTSFVDVRDIAAVAALSLREPERHRYRAYDLTGPRAVGYGEVASVLSAELGRAIVYEDISPLRYWREVRATGAAAQYAVVVSVIQLTTRLGLASKVTGEVQRLLGRPPIPLEQYIRDYRDVWKSFPGSRERGATR